MGLKKLPLHRVSTRKVFYFYFFVNVHKCSWVVFFSSYKTYQCTWKKDTMVYQCASKCPIRLILIIDEGVFKDRVFKNWPVLWKRVTFTRTRMSSKTIELKTEPVDSICLFEAFASKIRMDDGHDFFFSLVEFLFTLKISNYQSWNKIKFFYHLIMRYKWCCIRA